MTTISCNACRESFELESNNQRVVCCAGCKIFIDLNCMDSYTFVAIGEFEIVKRIGEGAMGTVYEAIQKNLDRRVALKILPPTASKENEVHVERFLHEMKLAAQIDHPYIVSVHQAGSSHGFPYYSMNLVNGYNLQEMVERSGPFSEDEALKIAMNVAEALESIWNEFAVVHRDIKPSNVMINTKSLVQVLDMGLAKSLNESLEFTRTGIVLGSPLFLSPEQAGQGDIDFHTDIFSLGATLYYLLTGSPPFKGESIPEILHNVVNNPFTPIEEHLPDIKNETKILLEMMMSKNKEDRFESWSDVVETFRYMINDSNSSDLISFDTSHRMNSIDKNRLPEVAKHVDFHETATSMLQEECKVSSGEYTKVQFSNESVNSPVYEALMKYSADQIEKIQGLTGIMDWVSNEIDPEITEVVHGFRSTLNETLGVLRDFSLLPSSSGSEVKYSLQNEEISIKHFTHRLKSEMNRICNPEKVRIIFETNFLNKDVIWVDVDLFMKMLCGCARYMVHGMSGGELSVKLINHNNCVDIEMLRYAFEDKPAFDLKLGRHNWDNIEGVYFYLASELADLLGGCLSVNEDLDHVVKFSFNHKFCLN